MNSKKRYSRGKKTKCQRLPGDDIWLFSWVLQALIFPALHYAEKKNRNILSLSDCNVTPEYPYNAIKGYEGSIVTIW